MIRETTKLKVHPNYIRKYSVNGNIGNLKKSIKKYGQIYPILVDKEGYILDGMRRTEAIGRNKKDVKILDIPPEERLEFTLMLNLSQNQINPMDFARALRDYQIQQGNISQREIARRLCVGRTKINYYMRLLDLPDKIQDKIEEGRISPYRVEKIVLGRKKKIETAEEFDNADEERKYESIYKRLIGLKTMISKSNLTVPHLIKIKSYLLALERIVDEKLEGRV